MFRSAVGLPMVRCTGRLPLRMRSPLLASHISSFPKLPAVAWWFTECYGGGIYRNVVNQRTSYFKPLSVG